MEALVKRAMRERAVTFKQALDDAVRAGATSQVHRPATPLATFDMGEPLVDVTEALRLAGEFEDQER